MSIHALRHTHQVYGHFNLDHNTHVGTRQEEVEILTEAKDLLKARKFLGNRPYSGKGGNLRKVLFYVTQALTWAKDSKKIAFAIEDKMVKHGALGQLKALDGKIIEEAQETVSLIDHAKKVLEEYFGPDGRAIISTTVLNDINNNLGKAFHIARKQLLLLRYLERIGS